KNARPKPGADLQALRRLQVGRRGFPGAAVGLDLEADLLALDQARHPGPLDCGGVAENVRAAAGLLDEAETLGGIEELYGTCGQCGLLVTSTNAPVRPSQPAERIQRCLGEARHGQSTRQARISNEFHR